MTIQVVGAFLAILSFSVLNNVPKKYLVYCGIEGAVGWFLYLIFKVPCGEVLAIFFGTLGLAVMAHIFARLFKAPVTVFLIPGILILVPGAGFYRFAYQLFLGTEAMANYYMLSTLQSAGMIALAIFAVDSFFAVLAKWKK